MKATLTRQYGFEAAHHLPMVHQNHKCFKDHGHSWHVTIEVTGLINEEKGWVLDYEIIDSIWFGLHRILDHSNLNGLPGLANPTSENIARWIWERMWKTASLRCGPGEWPNECSISRVTVWEVDGFAVSYTGTQ